MPCQRAQSAVACWPVWRPSRRRRRAGESPRSGPKRRQPSLAKHGLVPFLSRPQRRPPAALPPIRQPRRLCAMQQQDSWQVSDNAAEVDEQRFVPAILGQWATLRICPLTTAGPKSRCRRASRPPSRDERRGQAFRRTAQTGSGRGGGTRGPPPSAFIGQSPRCFLTAAAPSPPSKAVTPLSQLSISCGLSFSSCTAAAWGSMPSSSM